MKNLNLILQLTFLVTFLKLIRVESPDGMKRVELSSHDSLATLYQKTFDHFKIDPSRKNEYSLFADRARNSRIIDCRNTRATETIAHGDIIYLLPVLNERKPAAEQYDFGEEDQVDIDLAKQDGKIHRKRDDQL